MSSYSGQYLYPPRPKGVIPPSGDFYRRLEKDPLWIGQAKLNGQNTQAKINPDGTYELFNRHHGKVNYTATPEQDAFLKSLAPFAPLVINLELLEKQTKTFKNIFYIYDLLVFKGAYLLGSTVKERQDILDTLLPKTAATQFFFAESCALGVWRAVNFKDDWDYLFHLYSHLDIFEGLVLKKLSGPLSAGFSKENNGGWATRCRKRGV